MLNKLTLIIPTYERQKFMIRNMLYWSGRDVTVHILDGSENPIEASILNEMQSNIYYHHFKLSLRERLHKALSLIDTEYVALLGDDEFFMCSGLFNCIKELENDNELVACMGGVIGFKESNKEIIGYTYSFYRNLSVEHDDPVTRMIMHMKDYSPSTIYSVVRANVWKNSMLAFTNEKEFPVYAIGELQFEISTVFQGKTKVIPDLLWLRSDENVAIRDSKKDIYLDVNNKFYDWWKNSNKREERKEFISILERVLLDFNGFQKKNIRDGIVKAFDGYYDFLDKKNKWHKLKKIISFFIITCRKKILNKKIDKNSQSLLDKANYLKDKDGVQFDENELFSIYKLLVKFHNI